MVLPAGGAGAVRTRKGDTFLGKSLLNNIEGRDSARLLEEGVSWYLNAVRNGGYDYVVAMTRRCPNWMEAFLLQAPEFRGQFVNMITENALLMESEKLADYYAETGRFMKIALLDDVLVHGRSLNEFLLFWLELVAECLRRKESAFDYEALWREFCGNLTIYVYFVNDAPVLLKQEYQRGMHFQYIGRESEWRKFSWDISEYIWKSEIANTSYVISASIPKGGTSRLQEILNGWDTVGEDVIPYRGTQQRLYIYRDLSAYGVYATVRSYVCGERRFYTPYVFCGDLSQEQAAALTGYLKGVLERGGSAGWEGTFALLERAAEFSRRRNVYFQLLNLLLGQLTLARFMADGGASLADFDLDTGKIAYNFGISREIKPILDALSTVQWPEEALMGLPQALGLAPVEADASRKQVPAVLVRSTVEEMIYRQAVRHETYAKQLEQAFAAGQEEEIKRTGEIRFAGFLTQILNALGVSAGNDETVRLIIAVLTQMMDRGDVSLKARAEEQKDGQFCCYSSIRNTEMSLAIMPRKVSGHFREFFRLAQFFWRDNDFPQRAEAYFTMLFSMESGDSGNLSPEAQEQIKSAVTFANIICENRKMVSSMMDWREVFP